MSDQIGRHDATGPLALDAEGRPDPQGYVRSALQGRGMLLARGVLLVAYGLLWLSRGFGGRGGLIVLGLIVALDVAVVGAIRWWQWRTERGRRRAGLPPSWRASLFVMQARGLGITLPGSVRSDSRVSGRLIDRADHWAWVPGRSAAAKAVQPIELCPGWAPRVTARMGSHGFATFDDPSGNGPRLDFWVSRRRDLHRYLQSSSAP